MRVSVIVATYNRAGSLERLLRSLELLDRPESAAQEVLVVDNGSSDETGRLLAAEKAKPRKFPLEILEEGRRGKSNALNRGLEVAQGEVILLLDDDVVADRELLAAHVECHRATSFDAIQGRVLPGVDGEGRAADPTRLHRYNIPLVDYGDATREIRGLIGANMSFKRKVFEQVGFFDARLGPGAAGFGEDSEYSMRIRKAGFKIGYGPRAIVYHELNPSRYGRPYNRLVAYREGISRSLYRTDSIRSHVLPNLIANCALYGVYRLSGNERKAYKAEGRIMKWWGYLGGTIRQRRLNTSRRRT
jgi:glycosyltransferase involved in cell wall biosynthesis